VEQVASLIGAVPVSGPSRGPNDVSDVQSLRLTTLVTNPTRPSGDLENLAMLVMVPMRSCAGSEHDVVDRNSLGLVGKDRIGPNVAGEGRTAQFGLFARRAGIADNYHGQGAGRDAETEG